MGQAEGKPGFAALFDNPTVEAMYALSPSDFEHFVAYVLRRAGYDAKVVGPHWLKGVDVEMRRPGLKTIVGGVECKRYKPIEPVQVVNAPVVKGVRGAPSVSKPIAKPYVFTTSDFNEPAHQMAEAGAKRVHLMSGAQLVRYITYIRGSRYDDDDTLAMISPEFFCGRFAPAAPTAGAKVLTVANNKGGVGKTTTAYYLGAELARQGKRVLLIDLDSQANLTERFVDDLADDTSDDSETYPNITQYFSGQTTLHELITPTDTAHLNIIPADRHLTMRDLGGSGRPEIEARFARDVQKLCVQEIVSLGGVPDWIIIDTPPALSVFTRAALAAAGFVIAPIRPRKVSLAGTRNMLKTLRTMNALTNKGTRFLGAVITHWDNLAVSQRFEELLLPRALAAFGAQAFGVKIPMDNQIDSLKPGAQTAGAKAYEALAIEVLSAVN